MSSVLIQNAKALVGTYDTSQGVVKGPAMKELPVVENAFLLIENGLIKAFGNMKDAFVNAGKIIDATGKYILPAWCDSHTHIVFAEWRESEFADKIAGLSYEEIAKRGGGILNSVAKTREASEDELYEKAMNRLEEVKQMGTGAIEIKSGYGLSVESELKMLRVIRRLKENSSILIKATFLGAHAVPSEFKNDQSGYVELIIREMIPKVAGEGLADFIDVFCEKGYFEPGDTERILEAGDKYGLKPKVHVNQFNSIGGIESSVFYNALTVDHLEVLSEQEINVLTKSDTIPVALPGCSLFLQIPYTPARKIIDAGLPLALATDYNPGSSPSGNMNLVNSLACINMAMTPEEVVNASTLNGACAMELQSIIGSITVGKKAQLFITSEFDSLASIPYRFGINPVETVLF